MSWLLGAAVPLTAQSRFVALVVAVGCIVFILELIRRHKLQERYAVLWLGTASCIAFVGVFPGVLRIPDVLFGFRTPGLALFATAFLGLLGVVMHLTVAVSRQGELITRMAQELALERAQAQCHDERSDPDLPA